MKRNYKDLVVWQRAMSLVPKVYGILRGLPREEHFALCDQLRRAAVSIPANIAEGQSRQHPREFLQHLAVAKGSLAELHTLLILSQRLGYLSADILEEMELLLMGVARPLHGLMAALRPAAARKPITRNQQPPTTNL